VHAAFSPVRLILDQAFNQGNLTIVDELVSADLTTHISSWGLPASRVGLKQLIANLRTAFPDLHCMVDDEIGEGDKTAALWTLRGTHKGAYFGNQPTGRPVTVQGFIFARTVDGQIIENWILIDQIGLLQQLGIIPPSRGII
jgi:predicted ester cyclase